MEKRFYPEKVYPERFLNYLKSLLNSTGTRTLHKSPKFVFLCGKRIDEDSGGNRKLIKDFFAINRKDIICLYAEELFNAQHRKEIDLLTYEHYLAELSDAIILFVESFGTACELGAFSMLKSLSSKMLIINDIQQQGSNSFINEGPLKKSIQESTENVIYTDTRTLFSNSQIDTKLRNLVKSKKCFINRDKNCVNLSAFIIEMLDLIYLLGPITAKELIFVYKALKEFNDFQFGDKTNIQIKNIQISYILELLEKANLLKLHNGHYRANPLAYEFCGLMFKAEISRFTNKIRATAISRKFRHKEGIEECF
ncbi:MAG: retron St85 family effector protein [Clostridiaceae bacterium]